MGVEFEEISDIERSRAFKSVFGLEGKRTREQEIVYHELCGRFAFTPCFQMVPGVGMDIHLAGVNSGKMEIAQTIYNNTNIPEVLIENPEPEVTRKPERKKKNVD
jgi:hypothetical protein